MRFRRFRPRKRLFIQPVIIDSRYYVTNTVSPDASRFYRLRKP